MNFKGNSMKISFLSVFSSFHELKKDNNYITRPTSYFSSIQIGFIFLYTYGRNKSLRFSRLFWAFFAKIRSFGLEKWQFWTLWFTGNLAFFHSILRLKIWIHLEPNFQFQRKRTKFPVGIDPFFHLKLSK